MQNTKPEFCFSLPMEMIWSCTPHLEGESENVFFKKNDINQITGNIYPIFNKYFDVVNSPHITGIYIYLLQSQLCVTI
jgi:hypothetical protein